MTRRRGGIKRGESKLGFFTTVPSGKPQGDDSKSEVCFENCSLSSVFS